jgi:transposase InsO family protein
MPWKETCAMDQKIGLIGDYLKGEYTVTQLSEVYEVSRNTIYKWIKRYEQGGNAGLSERTKAPKRHPNATSLETAREIVTLKLKYKSWGPRKLAYWLKKHYPDRSWPAVSTIGQIIKQAGLVKERKRRHKTPPYKEPFQDCKGPNMVWSADYKGQFKTGEGQLCYPLTVSDNYSRYLLGCKALKHPDYAESKPVFEQLFKKYGLPAAIRTDNGAPFASIGLGGLSKLSVWFIKLGIKPERIKAGHPEENGRHERMHRSLKAATAKPPQANHKKQQQAFDKFRQEYNDERPHEALGMQTPDFYYKPSLRVYPEKVPAIKYHGNCQIRQVRHNGEIKWKGEKVYVSQSLAGEPVALKLRENNLWEIYFDTISLGILDELDMRIKPQGEKVLTMSPV